MNATPRLGALALAGTIALAGCGGTSAAKPGAAATIGGTRITTAELNGLVTRATANAKAKAQIDKDKSGFERHELTTLIDRVILAKAAAEQKVTVTQGEVDARTAQFVQQAGSKKALETQAAESGIAAKDLPAFIKDLVLQDKLGNKLVAATPVSAATIAALYKKNAAQYNQVHSAHILVKDKKTADKLLAQVKKTPSSFAALARKYSTDPGSKNTGGDLKFQPAGAFVKEFSNAIFKAAPGSYVEVKSQFGYHVIHVIEKKTTTLAEATPALRTQALAGAKPKKLQAYFVATAKKLKVSVSPRFGTWSAATASVTAPKDISRTTGSAKPSASASPTG